MEASAQSKPVILLVQPQEAGEMYAEFLGQSGLDVLLCTTAADAVRLAPRSSVIVTAIRLESPMDGIELTTRLKADQSTASTPVIVLTAIATPGWREQAIAAGSDVFLTKPCLPDDLLRQIKLLLLRNAHPQPTKAPVRGKAGAGGTEGAA